MPTVFSSPRYYDIAFAFRDIERETDVLEQLIAAYSRVPVTRVLEICCGHAPYLEEFSRRGYHYTGLDSSQDMLDFARRKARALDTPVKFLLTTMTDFQLEQPVDFAALFLGSLYLKNTAELIAHFDAVANALRPGGLYVLEWCVDFEPVTDLSDSWEIEEAGIRVHATYTTKHLNRLEQTYEEFITLAVNDHGQHHEIIEHSVKRAIYPQEFLFFIDNHWAFEFIGWWNDWDVAQPLTGMEKLINRPIIAVRRIAPTGATKNDTLA